MDRQIRAETGTATIEHYFGETPQRVRGVKRAGCHRDATNFVERMTEAWIYLLRCSDESLYTGWTVDLERRISRHQAGTASRYTRSRLPVELALALPMPDKTSARREEARIKRLSRAEKLALISDHRSA